MAAVIANQTSLLSSIAVVSPLRGSSTPSRIAFSAPLNRQNPILRSVLRSTWRPLHSTKVAVSDPQEAMNGDEDDAIFYNESEEEIEQKDLPAMETLILAYKKSILDGDGKSVEKIEEVICRMDAQKNALALNLEEMIAEVASSKDKLLRVKSDFENFRKQTENDHRKFTSDIQGEVLESLLPMVDSFERTKKEIIPQTEKEKNIEASYQGIYKQFVEVMRSLGVSVVETVGKPFDPSIHEAFAREESQQYKAGIVSQEIHRGFVQGKRILRTAKVKVSTGSSHARATPADNSTEKQKVADESVENVEPVTSDS